MARTTKAAARKAPATRKAKAAPARRAVRASTPASSGGAAIEVGQPRVANTQLTINGSGFPPGKSVRVVLSGSRFPTGETATTLRAGDGGTVQVLIFPTAGAQSVSMSADGASAKSNFDVA